MPRQLDSRENARRMSLYKSGLNDVDMANELGVSVPTIIQWRSRNNLTANKVSLNVLGTGSQLTKQAVCKDDNNVSKTVENVNETPEYVSETSLNVNEDAASEHEEQISYDYDGYILFMPSKSDKPVIIVRERKLYINAAARGQAKGTVEKVRILLSADGKTMLMKQDVNGFPLAKCKGTCGTEISAKALIKAVKSNVDDLPAKYSTEWDNGLPGWRCSLIVD